MVKIGDIKKSSDKSKLDIGAVDLKEEKAGSPTAGASKGGSSPASGEQRSLLEKPGADKTAPGNTTEKEDGQKKRDKSSDTKREKKEFYQNTVIHQEDVGKTLFDKIVETDTSADSVTELSETEMKFLDDMIFKGLVHHKIFIKRDMPVYFRSCPPIAMQNGSEILEEYKTNSKSVIDNLYTCMVIAVYLEGYGIQDSGHLYFSHREKSQEDFYDKKAIKERLDFCSVKMNGTLIDILTERLMEFLSLLNRIGKSRNVLNF